MAASRCIRICCRRTNTICLHSTNLIIILVMMQASKKVPFEDPMVLNGVRALYVISNLIIVGVYVYVGMQIDKKKGIIHLTSHQSPFN